MKNFELYLEQRLKKDLPGRESHFKMAPMPISSRKNNMTYSPVSENYRSSSVLVPIISWNGELEILFTLRTKSINHGGQISFPGGGKEGDESIEETALREANEEIGLISEFVKIAGQLSPLYVNHSDNMVTPVIGFLKKEQEFVRNPNEVDEIFSLSFEELLDQNNLISEEWKLRDISYKVPFWKIHSVPLWGATAMMLNEVLDLYRDFLSGR